MADELKPISLDSVMPPEFVGAVDKLAATYYGHTDLPSAEASLREACERWGYSRSILEAAAINLLRRAWNRRAPQEDRG